MGARGPMGGLSEPIGHSSEERGSPGPGTVQDPVCAQPWAPGDPLSGGQFRGCIPRTGRWCRWGRQRGRTRSCRSRSRPPGLAGARTLGSARQDGTGWALATCPPPPSCLPHCPLVSEPREGPPGDAQEGDSTALSQAETSSFTAVSRPSRGQRAFPPLSETALLAIPGASLGSMQTSI